jgi:hypothetical protein
MRLNWNGFRGAPGKARIRSPRIHRAVLEALEPRRLLSTDIVTSLNDSGAGSLRQTLSAAAAGDTIEFASSLSGGSIYLSSGQLSITQSVTIAGPAGGITINALDTSSVFNIASGVNAAILGVTITSGDAGSRGDGGDIYNSGSLTLTGDTISSGFAELGGGLYNNGGSVTIGSSTFSGSEAEQQGGAILNAAGGSIDVTGTAFSSNTAAQEAGGAICNENASLTVTGCTLTGNTTGTFGGGICNYAYGTLVISGTTISNDKAGFWGGGIFNYIDGTVSIYAGTSFTSNQADGTFGGGFFNDGGNAVVSGTSFTDNVINDTDGGFGAGIASELGTISIDTSTFTDNGGSDVVEGGGIYANDVSTSISSSSFASNNAQYGAGIYEDSEDVLSISGTTFENNTASEFGGGAYLDGAAYICNSTIAANQAIFGGGIFSDGTSILANCTVATNVGTARSRAGGGLYVNSGDTTIYNTIVATNTLANHSTASDIIGTLDLGQAAGLAVSSNNLIGTGGSGGLKNNNQGNKVGVSPNIGPLQNNGGSTDTMALLAGSPAIDAGNNTFAVDADGNPLATDQRGAGFARIVNGTVDIGAYEVQASQGQVASSPGVASPSPLIPSAKLPKAPGVPDGGTSVPGFVPAVSAAASPYVPAEIRGAYGVNDIYFNGVAGTGAGETIAIIDAYNDPDIIADANTFSVDYGLPEFNIGGGPSLQVLSETGTTTLPSNASPGTWDVEESLDVEWAHAIAPDANIILFEASSADNSDLDTAVTTAAATPGVSVVSMSYLSYQLIDFVAGVSETDTDSVYTTPSGHQGVTFLAATGDQGSPALGYPAVSPNVVAVGGTSLLVGTDDSYLGESAWSGGGGGLSLQEAQPGYQVGNVNGASEYVRSAPDVSMDADPETGVTVIDSYYGATLTVGGTSVATPLWAGLMAIVNQGLALRGQPSLDGPSQTLPMLYALPSSDFNDITTGDDGFPATVGYDLATGLGTPIANLLVPALAGFPETAVWTGAQSNDWNNPNNWNILSVPNATMNAVINFGNPMSATAIDVAGLTINGGIVQLGMNSGGSVVTSLSISGAGTLDLTNNILYIDFGSAADPISNIVGDLKSGYNSGAWTGTGIDSSSAAANTSYALGYSDGIDGVVAGLTSGEIEIAYTLYGDANLDFKVNGTDFNLMSTHFNQSGASWDEGDFNYDGNVNGSDFVLLSGNFNQAASQSAGFGAAFNPATSALVSTASAIAGQIDSSPTVDGTILNAAAPTSTPTSPVKTSAAANVSTHHTASKHHGRQQST